MPGETVFTISGATATPAPAAPEGPLVTFLGDPVEPNEQDLTCAEHVKPLVVTSVIAGLGGIGTGLFGVYKAGQRKTMTSLLSFGMTMGLWWFGGKLMRAALVGFETCRGEPRPGP